MDAAGGCHLNGNCFQPTPILLQIDVVLNFLRDYFIIVAFMLGKLEMHWVERAHFGDFEVRIEILRLELRFWG